MINLETIDLQAEFPAFDVPTPATWFDDIPRVQEPPAPFGKVIPAAGLLLALLASPATAVRDVWFGSIQQQATVTAPCIIGTFVGKPVSRAEALQISRRIIEQAEKERLEYAAREAAQLFHWDEEA